MRWKGSPWGAHVALSDSHETLSATSKSLKDAMRQVLRQARLPDD